MKLYRNLCAPSMNSIKSSGRVKFPGIEIFPGSPGRGMVGRSSIASGLGLGKSGILGKSGRSGELGKFPLILTDASRDIGSSGSCNSNGPGFKIAHIM